MRDKNRITMWVLAVVGALLVLGGVGWMIYDDRQVAEARGWPSVQGRIDSAQVATRRSARRGADRTRYVPRVEYRYTVGGTTYVNDDIRVTSTQSYSTHESAAEVLRAYPVGSPVQVFYSPADPRRSALRIEGDRTAFAIVIAVGLFLLGVGWWMRRKMQAQAMHVGVPPQPGVPPYR